MNACKCSNHMLLDGNSQPVFVKSVEPVHVDDDEFMKKFKNQVKLSSLSGKLSKMAVRMLFWLNENTSDGVLLVRINVREVADEFNQRSLTRIYDALKELEREELIYCVNKRGGLYAVSPKVRKFGGKMRFSVSIVSEKTENGWKMEEIREIA